MSEGVRAKGWGYFMPEGMIRANVPFSVRLFRAKSLQWFTKTYEPVR